MGRARARHCRRRCRPARHLCILDYPDGRSLRDLLSLALVRHAVLGDPSRRKGRPLAVDRDHHRLHWHSAGGASRLSRTRTRPSFRSLRLHAVGDHHCPDAFAGGGKADDHARRADSLWTFGLCGCRRDDGRLHAGLAVPRRARTRWCLCRLRTSPASAGDPPQPRQSYRADALFPDDLGGAHRSRILCRISRLDQHRGPACCRCLGTADACARTDQAVGTVKRGRFFRVRL